MSVSVSSNPGACLPCVCVSLSEQSVDITHSRCAFVCVKASVGMSVSLFHQIRVRLCHVFVCLCRNSVDVTAASMCMEDIERESMCWCVYSVIYQCLCFIKSGCMFAMCLRVSVGTVLMLHTAYVRVCARKIVLVCQCFLLLAVDPVDCYVHV